MSIQLSKGQLLISDPVNIGDSIFERSIILIADYNNEGAVGFIINKPLKYTINDLIPNLTAEFDVYNGGPVEQDNLYFIHNIPNLIPNSYQIADGIYWGGDFDLTQKLINLGIIKRENIRFFLGYTGWKTNQLETEIQEKSWVVTQNDYQSGIIEKSSQNFWKEQIMQLGDDYSIWANAPKNPLAN